MIAAGIIRKMLNEPWITEKELNFREFMKTLNRNGGGKVFELWPVSKIDDFMNLCLTVSKLHLATRATNE